MKEEFSEITDWSTPSHSFFIESHVASTMTSAHWHDHVELNLLLEGSMTYLFNGRQAQVDAGRLVLFWAAFPHQVIAVTPGAPLVCIYLPLADFLRLPIDQASRQAIMQGAFVAEPLLRQSTTSTARQWNEEWASGGDLRRQLICDEVALAVRRLVLDQADNAAEPGNAGLPHSQAVRHTQLLTVAINEHFAEILNLSTLADFAGVHATTANRAFREVLGISVMEYLTRYRLARAMQRLAETDDAILEIALDCGFGSTTRFYDVFKQRSGKTPRQFRLTTQHQPQTSS